jgi:hypothetical protein
VPPLRWCMPSRLSTRTTFSRAIPAPTTSSSTLSVLSIVETNPYGAIVRATANKVSRQKEAVAVSRASQPLTVPATARMAWRHRVPAPASLASTLTDRLALRAASAPPSPPPRYRQILDCLSTFPMVSPFRLLRQSLSILILLNLVWSLYLPHHLADLPPPLQLRLLVLLARLAPLDYQAPAAAVLLFLSFGITSPLLAILLILMAHARRLSSLGVWCILQRALLLPLPQVLHLLLPPLRVLPRALLPAWSALLLAYCVAAEACLRATGYPEVQASHLASRSPHRLGRRQRLHSAAQAA